MEKYRILFLFLLIGFFGCVSSNQEMQQPIIENPTELLDRVLKNNNETYPLEGTAALNIETREKGQKLTCKMFYNAIDTVKLSINTGFGYGVVSIWLTPDSFFVSNRMTKQFIFSSYRSTQLEELLGFPFTYSDIQLLFLGKVTISKDRQLVKTMVEPDNIVYVYRGLDTSEKIWVSKQLAKVNRIQRTNRKGRVILDISFDRYKNIESTWIAHQIQVYKPDDGQKLSLYFNSLDKSEPKSLKMEVPENMERIYF